MTESQLLPGATLNPDGTVSLSGYVIAAGPAQYANVMRVANGDPKAPYLVMAWGGSAPP